jgi:hypothetical protein
MYAQDQLQIGACVATIGRCWVELCCRSDSLIMSDIRIVEDLLAINPPRDQSCEKTEVAVWK